MFLVDRRVPAAPLGIVRAEGSVTVAPMSPSPRTTTPKLTQAPGDLLRIVAPLHEMSLFVPKLAR